MMAARLPEPKRGSSTKSLSGSLKAAGYPAKADPAKVNYVMVILLLTSSSSM